MDDESFSKITKYKWDVRIQLQDSPFQELAQYHASHTITTNSSA
jgi:hypothetical protein